jgi:hypothetical protein
LLLLLPGCATQLKSFDAGPYQVLKNNDFRITDPLQARELSVRVMYPDAEGPFPVVIFSTGMFCTPQLYDRITDHWVSHGYIVVQPNHMDSPNNEGKIPMQELLNIFPTRMRDVSFLAGSLGEIEAGIGIEGRMEQQRLAISGHSFGAVISQVKTGLHLDEDAQGSLGPTYDDRFQVAVLFSGVGYGMKEFADNAFDGMRKPFIASGGSNDVGRVNPGGMEGREWRKQPYFLSPDIDKYAVITEGSDHYLGGLICNAERGGEPDYEALAIVRTTSVIFLDAYLKDDAKAMQYLATADIASLTQGQASYQYSRSVSDDSN